jgi:hypothetical protein
MADFWLHTWLWPFGVMVISVVVALGVHRVLFVIAKRLAIRTGNVIYNSLVRRAERPTRWMFPLIGIILALPALPVRWELVQALQQIVGLGTIASFAWVIILLADVLGDTVYARYRVDIADNLRGRRVRTAVQKASVHRGPAWPPELARAAGATSTSLRTVFAPAWRQSCWTQVCHWTKCRNVFDTRLCIHQRTVETHRASICHKLQLNGANSLLRFALQHKSELLH